MRRSIRGLAHSLGSGYETVACARCANGLQGGRPLKGPAGRTVQWNFGLRLP